MANKKNDKIFFGWVFFIIFLTACTYLGLSGDVKDLLFEKTETADEKKINEDEVVDVNAIIEEYFASLPVRDVPKDADMTSFLVGNFAKSERDFKKTALAYSKVLKSDPENKDIKENLYQYYVLAGMPEEAEEYAKIALSLKPNDLLPSLVVLSTFVKNSNFEEVLKLTKSLNIEKNTFLPHLLNAWTYVGLNDYKKALEALEPLSTDASFQAAYLLHRAAILDYSGQTEEAAEFYEKLLSRSEVRNVRVLLLLKDFEARTHALKNKQVFAMYYAKVQEESFISKEMLASPGNGERVTSVAQGFSWVFFDLASAMSQVKDLDLALFLARLAHYLNPESSIIELFIGEILEEMQLLEPANTFYQNVKPNQNIFLSVQMRTIMNLIKMGQSEKAIEELQVLIKRFPEGALLHMTLGDAYRNMEDYKKALSAYERATQLANPLDPQIAALYFYQGVCFEAMGELSRASEFFDKALNIDSENPIYLNYAGYTLLEQNKDISKALSLIEKAVVKMPKDGNVLDSLGWAYYLMNDYEKALSTMEKAVSLQAGNAILNSHLGDIYWQLGRYREARFQWSHALTLKEALTPKLKEELKRKIKEGLPEQKAVFQE